MNKPSRASVVIVDLGGEVGAHQAALAERGLDAAITNTTLSASAPGVALLSAVVLLPREARASYCRRWLEAEWQSFLDKGVTLWVAVPTSEVALYERLLSSMLTADAEPTDGIEAPSLRVAAATPGALANAIASKRVLGRRPPNDSLPMSGPVNDVVQPLLRRAFGDMSSLEVVQLSGGLSGAGAYKIIATRGHRVRLLPFFAKVAERRVALEEYRKFTDLVADRVPFASRPNLVAGRSVLGARHGMIVGQLIDEAESLRDCLVRSHAPILVHRVFEGVLKGWWNVSAADVPLQPERLLKGIEHWVKPPDANRQLHLARQFKCATAFTKRRLLPPKVVAMRLLRRRPVRHHRGMIHGDLHSINLQVSGDGVFLIDFGSVKEAAILADPALLEASLIFEFGVIARRRGGVTEWKDWVRLLEAIYEPGNCIRTVLRRRPPQDLAVHCGRLWDAIRVVRSHVAGVQCEPGEYRQLVAAAMLRLASFDYTAEADRLVAAGVLYDVATWLAQ